MAKVSLDEVGAEAMRNTAFWKALRTNRKDALAKYQMELSTQDSERLDAILALDGKTVRIDLDQVMANVHERPRGTVEAIGGGLFWIGMWVQLAAVADVRPGSTPGKPGSPPSKPGSPPRKPGSR